jgi:hypothetical protein
MKRITALLLVLMAGLPLAARGDLCALDHVPAATLLLPYFEVDLATAAGRTTLFSINNAAAQPVLAHVTLWTDLAVPTLAFDVYLTGYDVQTINLRDIFAAGQLPRTADKDRDPVDVTSPKGYYSQDSSFPGCEGLPPPNLPASFVDHLQRAHSGQPSPVFQGQCAGIDFNQPKVVRGYATIDVVKRCTLLRPNDPGYFGADGAAGFDNVLWGDFFYVDPDGRFAQGDNLVRIEADPVRFSGGGVTFYGRYVNGSGADGREPLPTSWASRYLIGGPFDGGTALVAWREVPWAGTSFLCNLPPTGYPQAQKSLIVFDEEEHPQDLSQGIPEVPPPTPAPFAGAASRVTIGGSPGLPTPFNFGWALLDLSPWVNAPADPYAQAWVGQVSSSQGRYSVGFQATHLNSLCATAADRCPDGGQPADAGQLCVAPTQAGQPARFTVTPKGCFSSSCIRVVHAGCAVQDNGSNLQLDALICLQTSITKAPCTGDCGGGGMASCDSGALAAGFYTAHLGGLALNFQVPSASAACVSSP